MLINSPSSYISLPPLTRAPHTTGFRFLVVRFFIHIIGFWKKYLYKTKVIFPRFHNFPCH